MKINIEPGEYYPNPLGGYRYVTYNDGYDVWYKDYLNGTEVLYKTRLASFKQWVKKTGSKPQQEPPKGS